MSSVSTSFGTFFDRSIKQMGQLRGQIDRIQTQIATGTRIERGSQDPTAAAQLRMLARRERLDAATADNAVQLTQDLTSASVELEGVTNLLQRARELAVRAASDPVSTTGRFAIAEELEQLGEELFARSNATSVGGEALFSGLAAGPAFLRDGAGVVSYVGTAQAGTVPLAPGTEVERGLTGTQVFQFDNNGSPSSAFAVVGDLVAALRGGAADPAAAARDAIAGLDTGLDTVSRSQTILGTRLVWIDMVRQEQDSRAIDLAERRSQLADTQLSDAVIRLQQSLTALEASQAAFTRVNSLTLFNAI